MTSRWPSFLMTVAVLVGLAFCFKQIQWLSTNEVRAPVSIVFGLAISFLLLIFIWFMQKKPFHSQWPTQMPQAVDRPSMHPRGRTGSAGSFTRERRETVCTLSSMFSLPPDYEDALINSKPIDWRYLQPIRSESSLDSAADNSTGALSSNQSMTSGCAKHQNEDMGGAEPARGGCTCTVHLGGTNIQNATGAQKTTLAQITLNIVKGFTTLDSTHLQQQVSYRNIDEHRLRSGANPPERKISYSQLDASQLISGSPPKYGELSFEASSSERPDDQRIRFKSTLGS